MNPASGGYISIVISAQTPAFKFPVTIREVGGESMKMDLQINGTLVDPECYSCGKTQQLDPDKPLLLFLILGARYCITPGPAGVVLYCMKCWCDYQAGIACDYLVIREAGNECHFSEVAILICFYLMKVSVIGETDPQTG